MTVEGERRLLGGRYELQDRIASGGMGEVWRALDVLLRRPVAVKVLRSEYADDPTFIERFRAEARHAAALNHPNIAAVLDYGEAAPEEAGEHLAYLVMELVDGAPLSARLCDGPMEPQAALSVLRQTAAGLAEAHRRGLVHRDVKPANILVRPDGAVKLTDFGIARSADSVPLTGTGQVIGTAQYMSPEQAKGEPATPASDVYALGLVGYESLTGHAAFAGDNPVTVALKHVVEDPQPLPADLPDEVRGLIGSALAKDPGDRIPDGGAFYDAVQETLEHEYEAGAVASTRPVRALAGAGAGAGAAAGAGAGGSSARSPVSVRSPVTPAPGRRRALMMLLPLVALLLAAGTLVLVLGGAGGDGDDSAAGGPSVAADAGILLSAADHVGRQYEDVAGELGSQGLVVVRTDAVTAEHPAGTVLAVSPDGTRLDEGDEVTVTVAVAPAEEALPDAPDAAPGPAGPAGPRGGPVDTGDDAPAAPGTADAPAADGPAAEAPAPGSTAGEDPSAPAPGSDAGETTGPTAAEPSTSAPGTAPAPNPTPPSTEPTGPTEPTEPTDPVPSSPGPTGGTTGSASVEPPAPDPGTAPTAQTDPAPAA